MNNLQNFEIEIPNETIFFSEKWLTFSLIAMIDYTANASAAFEIYLNK